MKTIIEIELFGDMGCRYTDCIFVSDMVYDVTTLKIEFCTSVGITRLNTLPSNMVKDTIECFKQFLIKKGFRPLHTDKITICD